MDNSELKNLFTNNLTAVKNALKKSSAEMAKEMDVSVHTLNSYIKGERTVSLEMAAHLYQTYNINLAWFVSGEGGMFMSDENQVKAAKEEICIEMLNLLKKEGLIKQP